MQNILTKFLHGFPHSTLENVCAGGKIEKNEMGAACGAYGGEERCAQRVGGVA
jgi:hypothetical protein